MFTPASGWHWYVLFLLRSVRMRCPLRYGGVLARLAAPGHRMMDRSVEFSIPKVSTLMPKGILDNEADIARTISYLPVMAWYCRIDRCRAIVSASFQNFTGRNHIDGTWREQLHPEDVTVFDDLDPDEALRLGYILREVRIRRNDGEYRWHEVRASPIPDAGDAEGWLFCATDIDLRKRYEAERAQYIEELQVSEERLKLATSSAGIGIFDSDLRSNSIVWSGKLAEIAGISNDEMPTTREAAYNFVHVDDRAHVRETIVEAERTGLDDYCYTFRGVRPDGTIRQMVGYGRLIRDAQGVAVRSIGTLMDVTDQHASREQERLLLAELTHRVKNTVATIQSISSQTIQTAETLEDFHSTFLGRLHSISATHTLLIDKGWLGATFEEVLGTELRLIRDVDASRWAMTGPDLPLNPSAAVNIGLVLHELVSNAIRFGSFSNATGRVDVAWTIKPSGDEPDALHVFWRESGGPAVEPMKQKGFGTRLLTSFTRQLQGAYRPVFAEDGLTTEIVIPTRTIRMNPDTSLMKI
jgi:PAS domain S-box-containing protein